MSTPPLPPCPICVPTDVHRVHRQIYDFESTRVSNPDFIWTNMLRRYTIMRSPLLTAAEIARQVAKLRQQVDEELDRQESASLMKCAACPNSDVHRVHVKLYRFERIRRSPDPQDLWTLQILKASRRTTPPLTYNEATALAKQMRRQVDEELKRQAGR